MESGSWIVVGGDRPSISFPGINLSVPNELKGIDATKLETPPPAYEWHYRPEYQFSQFDLQINEINKHQTQTPDNSTVVTNILEDRDPEIEPYTNLLEVLYEIKGSNFDRLIPIDDAAVIEPPLAAHGGYQTLVMGIGEEEFELEVNQAGQIQFTNIAHLALLAPEDYLTLSLYANNDSANILWEFAFAASGFFVDTSDDRGSDANNSFIIIPEGLNVIDTSSRPLKSPQQSFFLTLADPIENGLRYRWTIESNAPNAAFPDKLAGFELKGDNIPATDSSNTVAPDTTKNDSAYRYWRSAWLDNALYKTIEMVPVELDPRHSPADYADGLSGVCEQNAQTQSSAAYQGTCLVNIPHKNLRYEFDVTVEVMTSEMYSYSANIKMDWLDVIRQEYINHHINTLPVKVPRRDEFGEAVATTNYTEATDGNCREGVTSISCLSRVSGNYSADVTGNINYTIGKPLEYAESIKTKYSEDTGIIATPRITSAWRNPERNEAVGGARRSNHQFGAALDLQLIATEARPTLLEANGVSAAVETWCEFAESAWSVKGRSSEEIFIENVRGEKPTGFKDIFFRFTDDPSYSNCVTKLTKHSNDCLKAESGLPTGPYQSAHYLKCSPTHLHVSR